ncbi:MAG: hypothetical protein ACE5DN_07870, partial [Flavobacteriales bacterium]
MLVSCIKSLLAACGIMLLFVACGMKDEEKQPQAKEEKPQPDHSPKFIHNRDAKVLPGGSKKNTVV